MTMTACPMDHIIPGHSKSYPLHHPSAIVPLLNGIDHLASLRKLYGAKRVIAATIAVESERVAPGHDVAGLGGVEHVGQVLLGLAEPLRDDLREIDFVDVEAEALR